MLPNSPYLWIACALCVATLLAHIFVGRRYIARPLLEADLHPVPKFTNFYTWHMASVTIGGMALAFLLSAIFPDAWELAAAATALSLAFFWLSLLMVIFKGQNLWHMPQWAFFLAITIMGASALNLLGGS